MESKHLTLKNPHMLFSQLKIIPTIPKKVRNYVQNSLIPINP